MGELDGKVAVITGGAKGIGFGCAECLSRDGATVVIADLDYERARESAEKLPGQALAVEHDVRVGESAVRLAEKTTESYGQVNVLINNAGVGPRPGPIQGLSEEEYDRVMDTNSRGVFLTTRAFVQGMIDQGGGRIINISSIVGQTGFAMVLQYVASKFAVVGMTQSLASELAPHGITVNSIHPGIVETDLHSAVVDAFSKIQGISVDEGWEWFRGRIPLGRFQTPTDIGEMAAFLASDRAKNITGAAFNVDGGWEMH
ncbi:MAG: 3-oxoacyl-ACP reductase FabG [Solirubrobacterales bacterium]|nr:3-oxoacyl-ACP reductase FabG [Solirubrobacterales bacterium]MBV9309268.1 3-oxoacyl-ACP reductase FabG [Solirubrobacterales bacterium]